MSVEQLRAKIVANALWGVRNTAGIHYSQSRPIDGIGRRRGVPLRVDCSGFVTLCYYWAGAPDPNGLGFNGSGYTGTILNHCIEVSSRQARPGDLVVFGPGTGDHVVVLVEVGRPAWVVSHGQEAGPLRTTLQTQVAAHRGPMRFVRSPRLAARGLATLSPQEMLPLDLSNQAN